MELLDRRFPDELQRDFERCARQHKLSPEAERDIARLSGYTSVGRIAATAVPHWLDTPSASPPFV
jgi:hypothetical protein